MPYANDYLLECARASFVVPPGTYIFKPPLDLTDLPGLRGTPGKTILAAASEGSSGTLIHLRATQPGDMMTGVPLRQILSHFRLIGEGSGVGQHGIFVDAGGALIEGVEVRSCLHGLVLKWSVQNWIRDSLFTRNGCNVYVPGSGPHTVTRTTFMNCNIREAEGDGILIQRGEDVGIFGCVIESNAGTGLRVDGTIPKNIRTDSWFENNGAGHLRGNVMVLPGATLS